MPKPFHALTIDEFVDLLGQFPFRRRVDAVHVHHTWRPNHANWQSNPGVASIEAMFRHHTQVNGWSDIAQHITIDPTGIIWTGRDWNKSPASAVGFNGTNVAGPFMFEMIGDFDNGRDPFHDAQKQTALAVVAHVMRRFGLSRDAVRFHNQMTNQKTCPGTAVDRSQFLAETQTFLDSLGDAREFGAFGQAETAVRSKSLTIIAKWEAQHSREADAIITDPNEPAEETMNANAVAMATNPDAMIASRGIFGDSGNGFTAEEKEILRKHVVNLRLGQLSDSGAFETSPADVERIFNELLPAELATRRAANEPLRLVFYAHGGLVSEESGIRPVLRRLPFWTQNGMYPIFFCWETGLKETVQDLVQSLFQGQRGIVSDAADAVLEAVAGAAGRQVWGQMKRVAELASLPGGGARRVAELALDFWNDHHAEMEIHALGHSAGSIFHAFFLPVLLDQTGNNGVPPIKIETLHFLAPACTTELFESNLMTRIGDGKPIGKHTMYTMTKELEKDDTTGPYRKSLLYFVSRAFEPKRPTPILGLEESLRDDPKLIRFYGLTRTNPGRAQILFSKTPPGAPLDSVTESTKHGDFDNEVKTMNSVARRILRRPDGNIVSFVDETNKNETTRALQGPGRAIVSIPAAASATPAFTRAAAAVTATNGRKKALCIGIDAYPGPNALSGCVNDARDWEKALGTLGFGVARLHNDQAKHATVLDAMRDLIVTASPGDVLVIQYSGHGTEVKDMDGDETNGLDQALVPVDFEQGKFIIDDEIREIMRQLPDGVNLTCFMDCCHSGTNTRLFGVTPFTDPDGSKQRFLPMKREWTEAHVAFRSSFGRAISAPARTVENMREVSFAACRSSEVAFETSGSGDFTKRALTILSNGFEGLTHDGFLEQVTQAFGPSPRQHPFLDCGKGGGARALLAALGVVGDTKAPTTTNGSLSSILSRLDRIEQRLSKLGA